MRICFDSLTDLRIYARTYPIGKKHPFKVTNKNGEIRYVLANNTDQAIAIVSRDNGAVAESVGIGSII